MSVTLLPLDAPLRIEVSGTMPARDPRIEDSWSLACASNPRLFDGGILAVDSIDAPAGLIRARPERFAHVVCPRPERSTVILSVTGVVESVLGGEPCVLLAQRGAMTRSYPGLWEFAPAGGLQASAAWVDLDGVLVTLRAELEEEVGVRAALHDARAFALVLDEVASSLDVVVRASLAGPAPELSLGGEHAWECARARWVAVDGVASFLETAPGGVIEPTWAIARFLRWVSSG